MVVKKIILILFLFMYQSSFLPVLGMYLMRIIYIIRCTFNIHSVVDYEHQHWIAL